MPLIPIILSGGYGSRLWPISRTSRPKPFIRLSDGQSLLQKTFLRAAMLPDVAEILTVTNHELFFQTEEEYHAINHQQLPTRFILEPFGRNTAAACVTAALEAARQHGDDATLLILPADHLITDQQAFYKAVNQATNLAATGKLVTFGITPDRPETGFGYIEARENEVIRFIEKPTPEQAKTYVANGNFLWNSGMFCTTAATLLEEALHHMPNIIAPVTETFANSPLTQAETPTLTINGNYFRHVPDISIDYALMEHTKNIAVVPCDIGWSDIGSWEAFSKLFGNADAHGNHIMADAVLHNSTGCFIKSDNRVIAAVGLRNLLIVDTPDALLVTDRAHTQDVQHIFKALKARDHESHSVHRTVHRSWGTYTVLEKGPGFKIKRLVLKPHSKLSLQMHHHRSEHWVVISGRARVTNGEHVFFVHPNESTYIPAGRTHRLENSDDEPLIIIETQTGSYLEEDDIVRFDDAETLTSPVT